MNHGVLGLHHCCIYDPSRLTQVDVPWATIFTAANVFDMELIILEALQWRLAAVTPAAFVDSLLQMLQSMFCSLPRVYQVAQSSSWGNSPSTPNTQVNSKSVRQDARRYLYFAVQGQSLYVQFWWMPGWNWSAAVSVLHGLNFKADRYFIACCLMSLLSILCVRLKSIQGICNLVHQELVPCRAVIPKGLSVVSCLIVTWDLKISWFCWYL